MASEIHIIIFVNIHKGFEVNNIYVPLNVAAVCW